ncbi:MAG: transcriptional regulator [Verrucomicrobiales bacterium]|nr:transcriptional regulator [Verrucomicrobiales bacterium]
MRKKTSAKPLPAITEAEWIVMRVLWESAPMTANAVVAALEGQSDWKPKTIHTLLRRLADKGALSYEKEGREFVFTPQVEAADCQLAEGRTFLDRIFGAPSLAPMLTAFVEREALSAKEIEELKRILNEAGRK